MPYFPPSTPSVKVEQLLHGLRGKKYRHRGKKYHIFSPSWIFVLFLAWQFKLIWEKIWYYVLYCLHFFQVSHNLMKHCFCSVILSLFFSFPISFLSFSPFLSVRALFLWYFFSLRPYLFQYIDPCIFVYLRLHSSVDAQWSLHCQKPTYVSVWPHLNILRKDLHIIPAPTSTPACRQ